MKTLKIFSDSKLSDNALRLLKEGVAPHELVFPAKAAESVLAKSDPGPAFTTVDIAFGQPDVSSISTAENLRWIHLSSAGYTRYDTDDFRALVKEKDLQVTNSSSVYLEACAEHVFAFMLANARVFPEAFQVRAASGTAEWSRIRSASSVLKGQSVVILGFGAIALRLVELLAPFKMDMVAMRRTPRGDEGVPVVTLEGLPDVLAKADHVINILPDNAASVNFFSAERFASLKPGAVFYNIGRGTTVDQEALFDVLKSGHVKAAWLDVTDPEPLPDNHPLWTLPNCYITPHTAGGHTNEDETLVQHFLSNFRLYLQDQALNDRVM